MQTGRRASTECSWRGLQKTQATMEKRTHSRRSVPRRECPRGAGRRPITGWLSRHYLANNRNSSCVSSARSASERLAKPGISAVNGPSIDVTSSRPVAVSANNLTRRSAGSIWRWIKPRSSRRSAIPVSVDASHDSTSATEPIGSGPSSSLRRAIDCGGVRSMARIRRCQMSRNRAMTNANASSRSSTVEV
jgi:hypothetical protein